MDIKEAKDLLSKEYVYPMLYTIHSCGIGNGKIKIWHSHPITEKVKEEIRSKINHLYEIDFEIVQQAVAF